MSDILGDFSNFEQDLSNLILIGDQQENFDDGQRWTSGIEPTGNNSKLKVEEFNTGGDEPSQPLQGQKFLDLGELNHLSASNSPPGKKDPLVGEDNEAVVKKSDNLINPNPINRRSGNSRNRADNIGTLSSSSSFTGFVGTTDTNDYYRFYLSGEREFNLTLNGLSGDADVRLLNSSGGTISSSTKGGSSSESISETLNSGTYYIRVYPMSGVNTNYNLNIEATSSSSDEEVNITSPSSSTSIEPGEGYTIRWTDNFSDNVKLDLYKGSSWQQTIASSTSSDGSYSWRAPTSLSSGTNYRIKIRNVNDSSVYDYSSYFTIEPDEEVNIYVSTSSNQIGAINEFTGSYTQLASTPAFSDIALSPSEQLFGITFRQLHSVDLDSGINNYVGDLGVSLNALGFSNNGMLYGAGSSSFYSIDTSSGAASQISSISGFSSSGDIVFDAARDLFWATSTGDSLWSIKRDGVGTKIGDIGYGAVYGLAFGDDKTLFGYTTAQDQLAINLGTGAGTFVRKISGLNSQQIWGAASEPDATATATRVPEPTMILGLLFVGTLFVGSRLQRK